LSNPEPPERLGVVLDDLIDIDQDFHRSVSGMLTRLRADANAFVGDEGEDSYQMEFQDYELPGSFRLTMGTWNTFLTAVIR
jgi:hypothetical protein